MPSRLDLPFGELPSVEEHHESWLDKVRDPRRQFWAMTGCVAMGVALSGPAMAVSVLTGLVAMRLLLANPESEKSISSLHGFLTEPSRLPRRFCFACSLFAWMTLRSTLLSIPFVQLSVPLLDQIIPLIPLAVAACAWHQAKGPSPSSSATETAPMAPEAKKTRKRSAKKPPTTVNEPESWRSYMRRPRSQFWLMTACVLAGSVLAGPVTLWSGLAGLITVEMNRGVAGNEGALQSIHSRLCAPDAGGRRFLIGSSIFAWLIARTLTSHYLPVARFALPFGDQAFALISFVVAISAWYDHKGPLQRPLPR